MADIAKAMGFHHVSLSSNVMPMVKIVPRGYTGSWHGFASFVRNFEISRDGLPLACADAYLTPCIQKYIEGFQAGFDSGLEVPSNALLL